MACEFIRDDNGRPVGFACSRCKKEPAKCYMCGDAATKLCDAKVETKSIWKACDIPMCSACAHEVGKDNHVCQLHFNELSIRGAKENRKYIAAIGWKIKDGYICPRCSNEENAEEAKFCKICGLKIEKESEEE